VLAPDGDADLAGALADLDVTGIAAQLMETPEGVAERALADLQSRYRAGEQELAAAHRDVDDLELRRDALALELKEVEADAKRAAKAEEHIELEIRAHNGRAVQAEEEWAARAKDVGRMVAWVGQFAAEFGRGGGTLECGLIDAINDYLADPTPEALEAISAVFARV
jgi:septal ring factor EnvC (AmiA/AmiB activator)